MKIDVEKLRASLAELGLEEDQIEEIIAKASEEPQDDSEGEGEELSTSSEEQVEQEAPVDEAAPEGEEEVVPPQDEVTADPESVPEEVVESLEPAPQEEPPVQPDALPPQEEVPPLPEPEAAPTQELPPVVSIEEFTALKTDFEELKKANEGLISKVEALQEALKSAGVIDESTSSEIGFDEPRAPSDNENDTTLDDVLAEINRKGY